MEKQEAQRRLEELREQVRYHSRKYYTEDDPEISDFAYDQLYRQLETLEAAFPELVTEDSPTQKVGGAVYNTFAPVTHQVPLESLHDSFSQEELREFDRRVREAVGEVEYVVEPKFDGLSVALEYRDGLFVRGSTRGDGVTGEDVTENIRTIRCVPKVLKEPVPFLEVRGEVYMSDESFARLCERQELLEEKPFKNPPQRRGWLPAPEGPQNHRPAGVEPVCVQRPAGGGQRALPPRPVPGVAAGAGLPGGRPVPDFLQHRRGAGLYRGDWRQAWGVLLPHRRRRGKGQRLLPAGGAGQHRQVPPVGRGL